MQRNKHTTGTANGKSVRGSSVSKTMRRVLKRLAKSQPQTAHEMNCTVPTLIALERRKLIRVETSFNALMFPRFADCWITQDGKRAAA